MRPELGFRSCSEKAGTLVVRRHPAALLALVFWILLQSYTATARADESGASPGFSVRKDSTAITEAIEDFERYRDKKAWEKAFAAIGKVQDAKHDRLLPGQSAGFFVPSRQRIRDELLTLPADGREAYRLFNDAKAAKLWQAMQNADADASGGTDSDAINSGEGEISLEKFVDLYFITSVGDQAADRLGDTLFEQGDFAGALSCWRMILDSYPDTAISPALLQTKCAVALKSAEQWDQFQATREIVNTRYAGQKIRIAGQDVVAGVFLDGIASEHSGKASTHADLAVDAINSTLITGSTLKDLFLPPATDAPAWQFPLMNSAQLSQLRTQLNQFGWGQMASDFSSAVPATAVDADRVYLNWFGVCFALDLKTGKMLWRTESFADLPQRLQQMAMMGGWEGDQIFNVITAGDRVLFVGKSAATQYGQQTVSHLLCLNGKTGKPFWKSDKGSLADWSFSGCPLMHGDVFYAIAHPSSSQEMSLLTIQLADGQLKSQLPLGNPAVGTNIRGMQVSPVPVLLEREGQVYVLTNNGALVVTDPAAGRVLWAYTFPTHVEQQQTVFYSYSIKTPPLARGAMLIDGGTLFLKEYKSEEMYALDLTGPILKWKRPVDDTVTLAAADAHDLFLVGTEADCIDRESHGLQWSVKLSTDTSCIRPIVNQGRMYVFGGRGVHQVQTSNGDTGAIFRGVDREASGGMLWPTPDRMVTVSNLAVTAYPVGPDARP